MKKDTLNCNDNHSDDDVNNQNSEHDRSPKISSNIRASTRIESVERQT